MICVVCPCCLLPCSSIIDWILTANRGLRSPIRAGDMLTEDQDTPTAGSFVFTGRMVCFKLQPMYIVRLSTSACTPPPPLVQHTPQAPPQRHRCGWHVDTHLCSWGGAFIHFCLLDFCYGSSHWVLCGYLTIFFGSFILCLFVYVDIRLCCLFISVLLSSLALICVWFVTNFVLVMVCN